MSWERKDVEPIGLLENDHGLLEEYEYLGLIREQGDVVEIGGKGRLEGSTPAIGNILTVMGFDKSEEA